MTDFDVTPFLHHADPWPASEPAGVVRRIYAEKYALAALLRPLRILEIGVRFGYSAAAFLSASPGSTYLGLDADVPLWGGTPGAPLHARAMLDWHFHFPGRATVMVADTQRMVRLPPGPWDLIHVDGDHSYPGCLNDLLLAASLRPRWLLVDDQAHSAEVARATRDWLGVSGWRAVLLPTVRGDLLAQPPA